MNGPLVCCVVPAHDEEGRVGDTVRAIRDIGSVERVVVVDDGSTDATAARAEDAGARVVRLPANRGKGAALEAGLDTLPPGCVIMLLDADLGDSAGRASALLAPVLTGEADMTVAVFPPAEGKAGFGLVKGLARFGIRRLGRGFESRAPLSGQRVLAPETLRAVRPLAAGFGVELAMTVRALRAGRRVLEVPVEMTHAATGRDLAGFLHRGRQFVHVLRGLCALWSEGLRGRQRPPSR